MDGKEEYHFCNFKSITCFGFLFVSQSIGMYKGECGSPSLECHCYKVIF